MNRFCVVLCLLCVAWPASFLAAEVPGEAERYLRVLVERPHHAVLFDRFQNAWLDERSADELRQFLTARAKVEGGVYHLLLARFHLRRGQDGEALPALDAAITALPDDAVLRIERARVHARMLDFDAAVEDLEKARMAADVEHALEAAKLLGQTWMRSGNAEMAVAVWNETIAAHPANQDLLEDLTELAASEGDTGRALDYMERLLEMTDDPSLRVSRKIRKAGLLGIDGRFDEALELCGEVLDAAGHGSWVEREVLAQTEGLFRRAGREADFSPHLIALAEAHPGRWMIHRRLAQLDADAGDLDAAVRRMRVVLRRAPGKRELREDFIRMLADGDRLEEAVSELETLIGETPQDAALWQRMADLQHRAKQPEKVMEALEKMLETMNDGEPEALRVASLMLGYGHEERGVGLLRERIAMPDATTAPAEMLANYFVRTRRTNLAVDLLADVAAHGDLDALLRAASTASAIRGARDRPYRWLAARRDEFNDEWRFLMASLHAAIAATRHREATEDALRLARMAATAEEMAESMWLVSTLLDQAGEAPRQRLALQALDRRLPGETALLATLFERNNEFHRAHDLLERETIPPLVWFHATMLMRQRLLEQAITRLKTLEDTPEGRRASYVKMLAELHLQAGQPEHALAYAAEWKLRAPDDRSAWIFHADAWVQLGREEEAMWHLRQAVARFDGAPELSIRLALMFADRDDFEQARAIHQRISRTHDAPRDAQTWGSDFRDLDLWVRKISERLDFLETSLAESPDDVEAALSLAFSPWLDETRAIAMIDQAAATGDAFAPRASGILRAMADSTDIPAMRLAIERIAIWLEARPPGDLNNANLSWVNHHARLHVDDLLLANIPHDTGDEIATSRTRTAERLLRAMLRHDATAEAGFRILRSWQPADVADGGFDAPARRAITAERKIQPGTDAMRHGWFTVHPPATGAETIFDELDAHSSWVWLAHRINAVGADIVLPVAFLNDLATTNPDVATLLRNFAAITDVDELAAMLEIADSPALDPSTAASLRHALSIRATTLEGGVDFHLARVAAMTDASAMPDPAKHHGRGQEPELAKLIHAFIVVAMAGTDAQMDHLATEADRVLVGPTRDWETLRRDRRSLPHVNEISHELRHFLTCPRAIMRVARVANQSDIPLAWSIPMGRAFRLAFLDGAAAMEHFLEETGLLRDARDWQPPVCIVIGSTGGPEPQLRLQRLVLLEHIFSRPLTRDRQAIQELRERLAARGDGKFGALMVLAALSTGDERSEFTARAFAHSATELAALPPERWETIAFATRWLSRDAIDALPPDLAARIDAAR